MKRRKKDKTITRSDACRLLNDMLSTSAATGDRTAVAKLLDMPVTVSEAFVRKTNIQGKPEPDETYLIDMIDVLNRLFGTDDARIIRMYWVSGGLAECVVQTADTKVRTRRTIPSNAKDGIQK